MTVDLSVLICSTHTRYRTFGPKIQDQVWPQYEALPEADRARVEIIMLTDNKQMMLGEKRNVLVDMAQGRYVQFVDDDDRIDPDMFAALLAAIDQSDADVITFHAEVTVNGRAPKLCRYSKDYKRDRNTATEYHRIPNHICCVKRDIAQRVSFPNVAYGEDSGYSKLLLPHLRTEHRINRVLYHYDYDVGTSETQQHRRAALRKRPQEPPLVDVVMMSNAKDTRTRRMTQHAINTCLSGANSLPIAVTVLEQQNVDYDHAATIYDPGPFNYNRFANRGAELGHAEWIVIANNDLVFNDGWLHELLAAEHPVVSPKNPGDRRQADITDNETGTVNGRHLSGWCYMIRRDLWRKIGGFDDCVEFWCSDDVTIEQVTAAGVQPMLVPGSVVRHLGSVTLRTRPDRDDLTWAQVDTFNRKYGRDKFADDQRYQAWKRRQQVPA